MCQQDMAPINYFEGYVDTFSNKTALSSNDIFFTGTGINVHKNLIVYKNILEIGMSESPTVIG